MKVITIGTCESVWNSHFVKGLKENGINVNSLAFPSMHPAGYIYQLYLKKNQNIIKEVNLIIFHITTRAFCKNDEVLKHNLAFYEIVYKILSNLQKKVLLIQWHHYIYAGGKNNVFHKIQAEKYGFNFIDTYDFCIKENLMDFYTKIIDAEHSIPFIYYKMAEKIAKNLILFKKPKKISNLNIPHFQTVNLDEIIDMDNNFTSIRTHLYRENIYKLEDQKKLKINFPKKYHKMKIIGVYTWNESFTPKRYCSCCVFENKDLKNAIFSWYHQSFRLLDYDFIINGEIKIHTFFDEKVKKPRYDTYNQNYENNHRVGIVGFLLISQDAILTTEIPQETSFKISRTYDFSYFYEYLKEYKIFTEQYNQKRDPIKSIPLRNQIKEKDNTISTLNQEKIILQNELNSLPIKKQNLELANLEQDLIFKKLQNKKLAKQMGIKLNTIIPKLTMINPNSAKARIHNHLSYKLGQALIENSKSVFGYIRMPFILSYIADKHKLEQKIYKEKIKQNSSFTLPPLETYPDYNEALKEKECFTYKLGEAFIKASNNWYGGGYIKFIFQDVPRLKKEFGKS